MATTITSNKKGTSVTIHLNSNDTIVVAGNSAVSNIASPGETLTGAYICQAIAGCDGTGHIQVIRGGQIVAVYDSTGQYDYAGCGMALNVNQAANLEISFVGSANGYLMLELQKVGTFGPSDYFQA